MLRLVLPKGSLEQATMQLFEDADLAVSRSSGVDYRASIDDPRVADVRILRPQEIPRYVADGLFDVGVTGRDWVEETGADVVTLTELHYSKATARPINVVLAVAADAPYRGVTDLPSGVRIHTEYPELTRRYFEKHGVEAEISLSYGATEAKVPEIADAVVEITETGRALRAAGLKVLDTILVSHTELIANPVAHENPQRRKAMEQIQTLLSGALEARGRVLVKLNVEEARLDDVIALLPALRSPTVSKLAGSGAYAVETVVAKAEINTLIPALKDQGATGIIELPIAKIVHCSSIDRSSPRNSPDVRRTPRPGGDRIGRREDILVPLHRNRERDAPDHAGDAGRVRRRRRAPRSLGSSPDREMRLALAALVGGAGEA